MAWVGGVTLSKEVVRLATCPYPLLVDVVKVHLCAVKVISSDPPRFVLTCEDCDLREESADADMLEDIAEAHRRATGSPLSA